MASHRIIQETECGKHSSKMLAKNSSNTYASPIDERQQQADSRGTVGSGLRTLPRLSASQAVHNFRDIYSDRQRGQGKYRHVSHADFHKSHDMGKKKREITSDIGINTIDDSQRLLASSHHDPSMQTPVGFSSTQIYTAAKARGVKGRHDMTL
eukprot:CAMPEP_0185612422 /NCGR_PEP_ID=MMETSP0436-20130131/21644_1 /TAXON_ID=626734 ORGANISM="Favella taraikaensis, Strain Fe Narragansett Bay" /NCGR_SAMPLE_ID=MMETSP0436 /ASSEMBLY_ACC=CAM_ASM_000390 /LENGTH=152 /DNA_ID=CAMNT_0028245805 /DNA_START=266 /DNA_END=724 /DNA_ORIENTATION=-